jgi:hypothetical protein
MRDFKFFRGVELISSEYFDSQRQVYEPLRLTRLEQRETERTINDAIRHEEYLHNLHSTHGHRYATTESIVDNAQMARDIRELSRLRMEFDRSLQRPNELLHRGRRPRNY